MDKLIKWLENSFAPKLQKITNLTWIVVIKDSMMQLLPFILAGSIFCVGTILNDYIPALPSFWTPFGWTMSKIGLMASFLIPFNYCEKKRFRKQRILVGCIEAQMRLHLNERDRLDGGRQKFGDGHGNPVLSDKGCGRGREETAPATPVSGNDHRRGRKLEWERATSALLPACGEKVPAGG